MLTSPVALCRAVAAAVGAAPLFGAIKAANAEDAQGVASSRMSYSRFLEYLDMGRVKKVGVTFIVPTSLLLLPVLSSTDARSSLPSRGPCAHLISRSDRVAPTRPGPGKTLFNCRFVLCVNPLHPGAMLHVCPLPLTLPFALMFAPSATRQVDLYEGGTIAIVEAVSPELGNRVQRVRVQLPGTSSDLLNKFREKRVDFASHTNTEDGGAVFLNLLGG